jgi:S-adenosylmethionine-diacylgycerolhomoserine-N-methlytransferase
VSGIGTDLHGYYRLHAPIYDATRGSFLFGRSDMVDRLAGTWWEQHGERPPRVLEIGCGTGRNLARFWTHYPGAELSGVELTQAMLVRAQRRLGERARLIQGDVVSTAELGEFDIVLCAYVLSMCGDQRRRVEACARAQLAPGGLLGVVDFHASRSLGFKQWMARNHVAFDDGWLERTLGDLHECYRQVSPAYFGWWHYASLIAQRTSAKR